MVAYKKMVYCPLFRISGSIIKPSRETLLDYCSYCLLVIALIGAARIWIGGSIMTQDCPRNNAPQNLSYVENNLTNKGSDADFNFDVQNESFQSLSGDLEISRELNAGEQNMKCAKYYQSVFAYVLLVESSILLFSGLIWTKVCLLIVFPENI